MEKIKPKIIDLCNASVLNSMTQPGQTTQACSAFLCALNMNTEKLTARIQCQCPAVSAHGLSQNPVSYPGIKANFDCAGWGAWFGVKATCSLGCSGIDHADQGAKPNLNNNHNSALQQSAGDLPWCQQAHHVLPGLIHLFPKKHSIIQILKNGYHPALNKVGYSHLYSLFFWLFTRKTKYADFKIFNFFFIPSKGQENEHT